MDATMTAEVRRDGERAPRWRRAAAALAAVPWSLRAVLFAIAVLHAVGLSWGMPASDGWDNDGVAPRDFLPGLAATYTKGDFYTYPPLHLAILALLTAPVTTVAVIRAGTTRVPAVLEEILAPSYMTAMAMTARIVCLVMSLAIVFAIAKIAEEISGGPRERRARAAGLGAAVVAGVGVPFTYYSHTSNLDVPSLFWATLAALALVRAVARREPRRLRGALVLAALATATKDQAYAVFLLGLPLSLGAWAALDPWVRANARRIAVDALVGGAIAALVLLVVDGAVTNPSGFRARLAFLSGSASQDYAKYSRDLAGRVAVVVDLGRELTKHYPWPVALLDVGGLASAVARARAAGRAALAASLVPLALALSFSIAFNMTARRVEERFTLPQVLFLAVYAGVALERAWRAGTALPRLAARGACVALVGWALFRCVELDANLVGDPRYETEAFLAREARPSDTIEVHGLNVYLPRLPPGPRAVRVGPTLPERRGKIPGLEEVQAPLLAIAERRPRFVVVNDCYAWRYLPDEDVRAAAAGSPPSTRIVPAVVAREASDADATRFFSGLWSGELGYRLAHESRAGGALFRRVELHASVGCRSSVFERAR